ncbi:putative non-specific serine/threonine protein kinase [Helianthus debilis subsp. tardiflorus]
MQSSARYKADKYSPKYELQAKLADFGLSKIIDTGLSHVSSEVRGTFGYVDLEYQKNSRVIPSGDMSIQDGSNTKSFINV